jgi:hypothetical protein
MINKRMWIVNHQAVRFDSPRAGLFLDDVTAIGNARSPLLVLIGRWLV